MKTTNDLVVMKYIELKDNQRNKKATFNKANAAAV